MTSYSSPFSGDSILPADVSLVELTIAVSTQLQWPINGDPDLTAVGRITEVTASAGSLSVYLPPANQASKGQDILFRNVGSNTFTVKDYAGTNTVISIAAGESKYVYIKTSTTEQGTWSNVAFGTGTSSADAATLEGYGLEAITTTLNLTTLVTTFSGTYTALAADRTKLFVWTGGAGTLNLTAAATLGDGWFIKVRNNGTGLLTIDCAGADTLNGSATVGLQTGDSLHLHCSGTAFYSVGLGRNTQFNFSQLVKQVSTGAYTLTDSEASNTLLKFTSSGNLAGNVTIIVPPTIQVMYVNNATTSPAAYTVTISVGTGGTTVALIPAQQAILVNDSYNIVNAAP